MSHVDGIYISSQDSLTPGLVTVGLTQVSTTGQLGWSILLARVGLLLAIILMLTSTSLGIAARRHQMLTIISGSMKPTIGTGSLVLVPRHQTGPYQPGDIVAFHASPGIITHRLMNQSQIDEEIFFQTKGDANPGVDPEPLSPKRIIGTIAFTIPYAGYVVAWLKTALGFAAIILLPATLLILQELQAMRRAWHDWQTQSTWRLPAASLAAFIFIATLSGSAYGLFSTPPVTLRANQLSTRSSFPSPTPSPLPTPTNTPPPCESDITVTQRNINTGPGSRNVNRTTINRDCEHTSSNTTTVTNSTTINVNTGGNTDNSAVTSGDVDVSVKINTSQLP